MLLFKVIEAEAEYHRLNSGFGKIRNSIAKWFYERPEKIKARQHYLNIFRSFIYKKIAFLIGNRAFNRKKELMADEKQPSVFVSNDAILTDILNLVSKLYANQITQKELYQFLADKSCEWLDMGATAIMRTIPKANGDIDFVMVAQAVNPNKPNYQAVRGAIKVTDFLGKSNFKLNRNDYDLRKAKNDGSEGVFARLVFEILSYYVDDQINMPFDMPVSHLEEDAIAFSNPSSSGGVPVGYDESNQIARGAILFSHDQQSTGSLKEKAYVHDIFAKLVDNLLISAPKDELINNLLKLFAVITDYQTRQSLNREQATITKLVQLSGTQAKELLQEQNLQSLKQGIKVDAITMFADLVSFTTKSNILWNKYDAQGVFKLPNLVFGQVGPLAPSLGAHVDKFGGDMLMIKVPHKIDKSYLPYLDQDVEISEGEMSAIATFITEKILNEIDGVIINPKHLITEFLADINEPLGMRVGYALGSTAYGLVGFGDLNSPFARYDLTSISPTVNLSARLESAASINNALYNQNIFDALNKLEISAENTPVLWAMIQHDPYLQKIYGEILKLNQKMKYYELKLESFRNHKTTDEIYLYKNMKMKELIKTSNKTLKGFRDKVPTYQESHLRNNANHAIERLYQLSQMPNDKLPLVIDSLKYLFHTIKYDNIAQELVEKYLDYYGIFVDLIDSQKNELKDIMFFRKKYDEVDVKVAYSQIGELLMAQIKKMRPFGHFIKEIT